MSGILEKDQSEMTAESDSQAYLLVSQWVLRQSGCVCTQEEQVSAMAAGFYMEWVTLGQGVPVVGARQELESSSWKKRASEASYWHLDC